MDDSTRNALGIELREVYTLVKKYTIDVHEAQVVVTDAKTDLELARADAYNAGKIAGTNDPQRKASEAVVLADEIDAVKQAEKEESAAQLPLTLAQLDAEELRWHIRLELGAIDNAVR